jgi:demethylmenaquinone methyltransferase/2-methoxy-6-polyprenyl-1,4-benzoquinol methylase
LIVPDRIAEPTTPGDPLRRESGFAALDLEQHLADPALKQAYVTPMFDVIAPRYDAFTRTFSFGMDRRWKERLLAVASAALPRDAIVADLATGTGDLALGLAHARPDVRVIAMDVSMPMLAIARARRAGDGGLPVALAGGDMDALPVATASLDGVTAGYGVRNAPDWRRAISELARVTRTGGHLFTLDFYRPESRAWRAVFLRWLWTTGRLVGARWHGEPMTYGYIARSIDHFVSWQEFSDGLHAGGFRVGAVRRYVGGGIAMHHAVRR